MSLLVPVLVAGGGIAYVVSQEPDGAKPQPTPVTRPRALAPPGGSTIAQAQAQLHAPPPANYTASFAERLMASEAGNTAAFPVGIKIYTGQRPTPADTELRKKQDLLAAYVKEQWENSEDVARVEMAARMNENLKLDPPLTGHEDWEAACAIVGAAGGGAVGNYFCGTVCGKAGAMVGAWLGEKAGPYLEQSYDWLEEKIKAGYSASEDWVSDTASDVGNWFQDLF